VSCQRPVVGLVIGLVTFLTMLAEGVSANPQTILVPMRDGIRLATDVYLPPYPGPWPAVLTRTPYGKSTNSAAVDSAWIALLHDAGYAYVVQDSRGRFASEGTDSTFWTDGWGPNQDGYETVEWVATRSWCNGRVGMYGESARGIVQYLAAGAAPPSLVACVSLIACEDFYAKAFFQGGAYREALVEGWFGSQDAEAMLPFFLAHPTRDPFWDRLDLHSRLDSITVPVLHVGGHYDVFGESAIDAFTALETGGGEGARGHQKLVLGPWTHRGMGDVAQGELVYPAHSRLSPDTLAIRWFDRWLRDIPNGVDLEPAVRYYQMGDVDDPAAGGNQWRTAPSFPPPETTEVPLYLHAGDSATPWSLQWTPPGVASDGYYYTSDPGDPFSARGGRNLFLDAGPYDQRPAHFGRTDGVSVQTAPLPQPLAVAGKVRLRFWAEMSVVDADWSVQLIDVYPDGRAMLVTDGILRTRFRHGFEQEELLPPWTTTELEVDLWSTAITFAAGHRIQVVITGANAPRFAVNPQTGDPFGAEGTPVPGFMGVFANALHPSHLILPVSDLGVLAASGPGLSPPTHLRLRVTRSPARRVEGVLVGEGAATATVTVYSVAGQRLEVLGPERTGDGWTVRWDGRTGSGTLAPSGVYYLSTGTGSAGGAARVLLLR
jgi:hypothetical protein